MRMKSLSLVMGAALGASAMQVSADALLLPYFRVDNAVGIDTYYLIKTSGNAIVDAGSAGYPIQGIGNLNPALHLLHFNYFYKDLPLGWNNQTVGCPKTNKTGTVSSWDLVYGAVNNSACPTCPNGNPYPAFDKSEPPKLGLDKKEGFIIIEEWSTPAQGSPSTPIGDEGNLSGEAWIVNLIGGHIVAYKMLNNPESTDANDWDTDYISKSYFDMMWWATGTLDTAWPTLVVGNNMLSRSVWNGAVTLKAAEDDDTNGGNISAVYNNDEKLISAQKNKPIVCAGWVTRNEIMEEGAVLDTTLGGWGRYTVRLENDGLCDPANTTCPTPPESQDPWARSTGALMMKYQQLITLDPREAAIGFTIETSGPGLSGIVNYPY